MIPFYEEKPCDLECSIGRTTPFPLHLHLNLELIYCQQGEATVLVENQEITLQKGDLVIIFPNLIHALKTSSDDCICSLFICSPHLFEDFQNILTHQQPVCPVLTSQYLHLDILYALSALEKEVSSQTSLTATKYLVHLLLARLLNVLTLETRLCESSILMHEVITYICAHYTESISLDNISITLGVSKYQISRLFSKHLKLSFTDYLNSLRINHSKTLLKDYTLCISEIAMQCGFETQRHFNRVFKHHCQCSPSHYRESQLI